MRAAVLYAPKDLRIEQVATTPLGPSERCIRTRGGPLEGDEGATRVRLIAEVAASRAGAPR